jgi:hypothetical protein
MGGTVYAGYIYLIGGQAPGVSQLNTVYYAKIDNNNNIVPASGSAWTLSPNTTSSASEFASAFGYNGYIYVVGGYNSSGGVLNTVQFAEINTSDGSIDSFNTSASTITAEWGASIPVNGSYAYLLGGCGTGAPPNNCTATLSSVQSFQIFNNDSGAPAGYTTAANTYTTDPNRIGVSSAILDGYIYVAGGCTSTTDCTATSSDVSYAPVDSDGNIGAWSSTTNLPNGRAWGQLETAGGSLYYIGGQDSSGTAQSSIYYATPGTSGGYLYRQLIALNHAKVSGGSDLSTYPVLVSLTESALKTVGNGGYIQNSNGYDMKFTDASGSPLNFEVEQYNGSTGQLIAWVNVPTLSASADTQIYLYFDNSSISTFQGNVNGTWNSNYNAVWHLPNGTTLSTADSTANNLSGTNHGATATTGQIGGGASFSGSSQYISVPSTTLPSSGNFTVSLWFKTTSDGVLFSEQNQPIGSTPSSWDPMLYVDSTGKLHGGIYIGSIPNLVSTSAVNNGAWHYAVLTVNKSSSTQSLYLDGSLVGTANGTPEGPFTNVSIGAGYDNYWPNPPSTPTSYFNGQIDEVRVANSATALTSGWITTDYNNQSSPANFETAGPVQSINSTGGLSSWGTATNGLPAGLTKFGATVWNNRLYVLGGTTGSGGTQIYSSSGTFVVPAGFSSITVQAWGGGGGGGGGGTYGTGGNGGGGGYGQATLSVTPGESLNINVGGGGGGGQGSNSNVYSGGGGGGGGDSSIYSGSTPLVVAAGGGGGGGSPYYPYYGNPGPAGAGGGTSGTAGGSSSSATGGGYGSQTSGGSSGTGGNNGTAGGSLSGGAGANGGGGGTGNGGGAGANGGGGGGGGDYGSTGYPGGGGGGGGYYGGGGGGAPSTTYYDGAGGGGGGSTYITSTGSSSTTNTGGSGTTPGNTTDPRWNNAGQGGGGGAATAAGANGNSGEVVVSYGSFSTGSNVYISPQLNTGGDITSAWSSSSPSFSVARNGLTAIAYANNLYVLGGYNGTNYLSDVQYAQISTTDGSVGNWSYSTSLPTPLSNAGGFAANGYMYLMGGTPDGSTCQPITLVAPISANTPVASGNTPTGIGQWYQTRQNYSGNRYGAAVDYYNGKAYVIGGACGSGTLTYASPVIQQSSLLSEPQVAQYSIMFDTNTDVYPNYWLLNGVDNSIGAKWQLSYSSMTNITTSCTSPAMTTWGQTTTFGNVTLGTPEVYTPKNNSGINTNCARFYDLSITVDSSQAYGYPDDVTRGPTITNLTLQYSADPSRRLMHGRTFIGGLQQPDDTPYYSH